MLSLIERSLSLKNDRFFYAGADLHERFEMDNKEVGLFVERLRNRANSHSELEFPTIAAIDGAAFRGGLEFALA
uniref:Uncharacterized protein n=1 Tax=Tetranychus urticae TaxID=32264 RepID=T1L4E1_TETUR